MKVIYRKSPEIKGCPKELVSEPVIITVNDINESAAKEFSEKVSEAHNTGQTTIPVLIDSYGGDVYALVTMFSAIENSKLPVCTIARGKAMSAGAMLLAYGHPGGRFIDPNAVVMLHEVSSFNSGKLNDLSIQVNEIQRLNSLLFQKVAINCGYKKNKEYLINLIQENFNSDLYLTSFEAQEHKLVDNIGVPEFHINISSSMDLVFSDNEPKKKQPKKTNKTNKKPGRK